MKEVPGRLFVSGGMGTDMTEQAVEELIKRISSLDRKGVIGLLQDMPSHFPMDFSPEFLANCSVEKLRHILLAACLHAQGQANPR